MLALPAVAGAVVASPADGNAAAMAQNCVSIADEDGWAWQLCGIEPRRQAGGPVRAGQMIGTAAGGEVAVALLAPDGRPACPGAVFAHWAGGKPWSPQAIDDAYAASDDGAAEPAGPPAGLPPELGRRERRPRRRGPSRSRPGERGNRGKRRRAGDRGRAGIGVRSESDQGVRP